MKISVHVSSDKSLRLLDSTESAEGITTQDYKERREVTQRRSKKKKSWRKKIVLISSAIYFIYIICLVLVFIFHFILIHFSSYPRLSTFYSRLSTLDIKIHSVGSYWENAINLAMSSWHLSLKDGFGKFWLLVCFVSDTQLNFESS